MTTATMKKTKPGREALSPAIMLLWREQMGFNQREAAEALGCAREALSGWENGVHRIPIYIGLAMNALALNMTPYGSADSANDTEE